MQREKDKFFRISHRDKYFNLKLIYTTTSYYDLKSKKFGPGSKILILQVISSVFTGIIWLNDEDIMNIMKLEYDYRRYDRNYNYYAKLKTNKIEPSMIFFYIENFILRKRKGKLI